ncbi:unnamed protein product [Moneuplotes crassus]|uniref:Uncharacterized protein n=1 Tax=Euplotes crassus TaxID=5936 RepID=A0AAD1U785_EUPCR|nr:unnamed protein product [Moneuplotes crassus]
MESVFKLGNPQHEDAKVYSNDIVDGIYSELRNTYNSLHQTKNKKIFNLLRKGKFMKNIISLPPSIKVSPKRASEHNEERIFKTDIKKSASPIPQKPKKKPIQLKIRRKILPLNAVQAKVGKKRGRTRSGVQRVSKVCNSKTRMHTIDRQKLADINLTNIAKGNRKDRKKENYSDHLEVKFTSFFGNQRGAKSLDRWSKPKPKRLNISVDAQYCNTKRLSGLKLAFEKSDPKLKSLRKKTKSNKQKIYSIIRNCQEIEGNGKKVIRNIDDEQSITNIYNQGFNKTCQILQEVDFAEGKVMELLYQKRQEDINEDIDLADQIAKEYRTGQWK